MSNENSNPQTGTCRICHSAIVRYGRESWYHSSGTTSPPYPSHYAVPEAVA